MNPEDLEKQMERLDALMARMGAAICIRCLKCGKLFETTDFRNGNPVCAEHIATCKAPSDIPVNSSKQVLTDVNKDRQHKEAPWIRITQKNKVLACLKCNKKTMRGDAEREFIETHKRCE